LDEKKVMLLEMNTHLSQKLYEVLAKELIEKIVNDDITPGQYLPTEQELCKQYNVSKTVIRETIKVLSVKGLVRSRHGIGTIVIPREEWNILDRDILLAQSKTGNIQKLLDELVVLRRIVEVEAAALAAEKAKPLDIEELQETFELMQIKKNNIDAYNEADIRFHDLIIKASQNLLFRHVMLPVTDLRRLGLFISGVKRISGNSIALHGQLLESIMRRDSMSARKTMMLILEEFDYNVKRSLEDNELVKKEDS
jgi:GntR family galactonate operon transcriptional repressor